jgi:AraC-like DNA-binding protein
MSEDEFGVEEFGDELNMSRAQVYRKLTALTNLSPGEFIWYMRLHRGMDLLRNKTGTISEIAYSVGFRDPSHFSKRFMDQFGVTPGDVLKNPTKDSSSGEPVQDR